MFKWLRTFASAEDSGDSGGWKIFRRDSSSSSNGDDEADRCVYSRVVRKSCKTVEDPETGKPIMKCEKIEQLLKNCPGRQPEVVESKTEHTEEEVSESEEQRRHFSVLPGIGDDANPLSRFLEEQIAGGIEGFMQAAEELADDLFGQFGYYRRPNEDEMRGGPRSPFERATPGRRHGRSFEHEDQPNDFAEFSRGFKEI